MTQALRVKTLDLHTTQGKSGALLRESQFVVRPQHPLFHRGSQRRDERTVWGDHVHTRTSVADAARPRTVRRWLEVPPGTSLSEAKYHTITSCKAPCNRTTGIAYPIANGSRQFDSAELGYGPAGFTPASNRNTWETPKNLPRGTYTYFCRIHPFMRGAFRVK